MKQICPVHCFSYEGKRCPFCERERIEELSKRYRFIDYVNIIGDYEPKSNNDIKITEEHLKKLAEKFKVKIS